MSNTFCPINEDNSPTLNTFEVPAGQDFSVDVAEEDVDGVLAFAVGEVVRPVSHQRVLQVDKRTLGPML